MRIVAPLVLFTQCISALPVLTGHRRSLDNSTATSIPVVNGVTTLVPIALAGAVGPSAPDDVREHDNDNNDHATLTVSMIEDTTPTLWAHVATDICNAGQYSSRLS